MQLANMVRYKMGWARPSGPEHGVVLSSRIRMARNLKSLPFPCRAKEKDAARVLQEVFEAAAKSPSLKDAARIALKEIDATDRAFLVERHLISNDLASQPRFRGVVVGDQDRLSLMVNEEDHIRLQGIDSGLCLKELLGAVDAVDDELAASLDIAFHPRWGFLTACPTNTGTGLRASSLVHLAGLHLTGELQGVLKKLSRFGLIARGLYGEGTKVMGDFYQISNAVALGPSEVKIIQAVSEVVAELVKQEIRAREELSSGSSKARLEDMVYRSLGVLTSARLIGYEETMQHLSHVRIGLSLGWRFPADLSTINEMIVLAQPAHIEMLTGKPLTDEDRDLLRAALLRRRLRAPAEDRADRS